jgi:hypothetical protein
MSGASSRTKGHNFEREVAKQLREIYPDARRGLQYQDGTGCPDVVGTPFHVECKVGKKPNIRAALRQAKNDCKDDSLVCIAVTREDRKEPTVTLDWTHFLEILKYANYGAISLARERQRKQQEGNKIVTL